MSQKKRRYTHTTIKLAPFTVDEVLSALLKTPPPPKGDKGTRMVEGKAGKQRKAR